MWASEVEKQIQGSSPFVDVSLQEEECGRDQICWFQMWAGTLRIWLFWRSKVLRPGTFPIAEGIFINFFPCKMMMLVLLPPFNALINGLSARITSDEVLKSVESLEFLVHTAIPGDTPNLEHKICVGLRQTSCPMKPKNEFHRQWENRKTREFIEMEKCKVRE
jgi:hypothetical protein